MLIVDAIKKANASCRAVVPLIFIFLIGESRDATDQFSFFIFQYPPYGFSMTECFIFLGIKHFVNVLIKWTDIIGIVFIDQYIYIKKFFRCFFIGDLGELHRYSILTNVLEDDEKSMFIAYMVRNTLQEHLLCKITVMPINVFAKIKLPVFIYPGSIICNEYGNRVLYFYKSFLSCIHCVFNFFGRPFRLISQNIVSHFFRLL